MKKPVSKDTLQSESENLYKYFYDSNFNPNSEMFLQILTSRGIYKKHYENVNVPEYVLYNIGEYTSAPYKVVWKALASKGMEACVISSEKGKLIIPDHNNVMVPFEDREEAYYFCAIVNSKLIGEFIDSYISCFPYLIGVLCGLVESKMGIDIYKKANSVVDIGEEKE